MTGPSSAAPDLREAPLAREALGDVEDLRLYPGLDARGASMCDQSVGKLKHNVKMVYRLLRQLFDDNIVLKTPCRMMDIRRGFS